MSSRFIYERLIALLLLRFMMLFQQTIFRENIVCFGDSITLGDGITNGQNYPSYLKKLLS